MKKLLLLSLAGALLSLGLSTSAEAANRWLARRWAARFAATMPWHGDFYYTAAGVPVALVVPPNVKMHREMGWGVSQSEMTPIWSQFGRNYPGTLEGAHSFQPTPHWPSHTSQFGVYYIRGPW